ncbi:MAG: bifunctional hydroxymethylpyrimidine kinase/phosphomethylpyrimidine kinase [Bacteroidales bacterium]|nr:bifunctional hydroxymethylpyrimidine kinase/phosphomethylpyrimidine kinase [Bacteroidales bacterium]
MVAMWPILTYYGHAVYNLPTALVSNNFDYGDYSVMETTAYMRDTLPVWQRLHFAFDAVCTGYMFSDEQARLVADYSRSLAASGTALFVDPVMADSGSLYHGLDAHHIDLMRDMVSVADLTFPNYTEACLLTDTPFRQEGMTWEQAVVLMDKMADLGAKAVVVTSAKVDGHPCVIGRRSSTPIKGIVQDFEEGRYFRLDYDEIPIAFPGTGDIFSSVLIGHLMSGETLKDSTLSAMAVVRRLIDHNRNQDDIRLGIPIEQFLHLL